MGPARGAEVRTAVALDEPLRRPDPLRHPLVLGAAAVGGHHLAGGEDHGVQLTLAGERAGHRLVVAGDAFGDPAAVYQGDADAGERAQLEVAVPGGPAEPVRPAGQVLVPVVVRGGRLSDQDPSPQWLEFVLLYQPGGPRRPSGSGCVVAEVCVVEDAELDGGECGLGMVELLAEP